MCVCGGGAPSTSILSGLGRGVGGQSNGGELLWFETVVGIRRGPREPLGQVRAEPRVVMAAVKQDGLAWRYAASELRGFRPEAADGLEGPEAAAKVDGWGGAMAAVETGLRLRRCWLRWCRRRRCQLQLCRL